MSGNRDPYKDSPTGFEFVWKNSGVILNEVGVLYDQSDSNASKTKSKLYPGLYKVGFANNPGRQAFSSTNGVIEYSGNYNANRYYRRLILNFPKAPYWPQSAISCDVVENSWQVLSSCLQRPAGRGRSVLR